VAPGGEDPYQERRRNGGSGPSPTKEEHVVNIIRRLLGGDPSVRDPVCGMTIPQGRALATAAYQGSTYYFCSRSCKEQFEKEPERYISGVEGQRKE